MTPGEKRANSCIGLIQDWWPEDKRAQWQSIKEQEDARLAELGEVPRDYYKTIEKLQSRRILSVEEDFARIGILHEIEDIKRNVKNEKRPVGPSDGIMSEYREWKIGAPEDVRRNINIQAEEAMVTALRAYEAERDKLVGAVKRGAATKELDTLITSCSTAQAELTKRQKVLRILAKSGSK